MKKISLMIVILAVMFFSAGCETVKGVGRDITGASSSIQERMSSGGSKSAKESNSFGFK